MQKYKLVWDTYLNLHFSKSFYTYHIDMEFVV